ncbi:MAG: hypothetical protein PHX80_04620 [Candidatus Nanoarchaeia archaeon]|nr:hypothetical protein [Candidatus Nanoarchaeia archaeon]
MTDHQTKLLYATLIGAIGATLTPNPGDIIYWKKHKELRDQWSKGEITSKDYWRKHVIYNYIGGSVYWISILGVAYIIPGSFQRKVTIALGLIGAGALFSVIYKHQKNDEDEQLAEKNALKQRLLETADATDINDAKNS